MPMKQLVNQLKQILNEIVIDQLVFSISSAFPKP